MKKSAKIWLVTAAILVTLGLFLFVGVMFSTGWDFSKIGTLQYVTKSYEISEDFNNISINTHTADIKFELSFDGKCRVVYFGEEKTELSVLASEDTLVVNQNTDKAWYDYININFVSPKITVFLPKTAFNSVFINESTGNIFIEKISANSMELNLSTGHIELSDIACQTLTSTGGTGDVALKNVIASKSLTISRSTGDIEFMDCDAPEIFVSTDTGDVEGTLLSKKVFITNTSTGKVNVPKSSSGGRCQIITSTGDIEISVKK